MSSHQSVKIPRSSGEVSSFEPLSSSFVTVKFTEDGVEKEERVDLAEFLQLNPIASSAVEVQQNLRDASSLANSSHYLYVVVNKVEQLERKDVKNGGVAVDAWTRWQKYKSNNREFTDTTHRMLILHKCTVEDLPDGFSSVHSYVRILERALYSFEKDFDLVASAHAGEGKAEQVYNGPLLKQEHKNFVEKLLKAAFENPCYLNSNDDAEKYFCAKCGASYPTGGIRNYHTKTCIGKKTETAETEDQNASMAENLASTKRKAEDLKKPPGNQAFLLWYESVKRTVEWKKAGDAWKNLSDDEKKPFKEQAREELDQYYRDLTQSDQPKKPKRKRLEGEPNKPKIAYNIWLTNDKKKEIRELDVKYSINKN